MKLTESEQERLAVALNVALGIVSADDVDPEELGYSWRCRMNEGEIRNVCHNILLVQSSKQANQNRRNRQNDH